MKRRLSAVTTLFPLWALLASAWAYVRPAPWAALQGGIVPLLGLVMFGMGLTLTGADFRRVFQRPGPIALGMAVQFGLMPLLALGLARALHLDPPLAAGMVLVGCVSALLRHVLASIMKAGPPGVASAESATTQCKR